MKLEDVKDRIDNFFESKTSEELYELGIQYGLKQVPQRRKDCFERFKESLEKLTDAQFEALLDEMEEEGEKSGCGITVGEFIEKFITNYDDLENKEDYNDEEE